MKSWAITILTYPVIFVLALIFVGPTLPIDMSILIISAIVAAIGLSREPGGLLQIRASLAAFRSRVASRLRD